MTRSLSALATNNSRPTHPLQDVLGALCRLDDDDGGDDGGVDGDVRHIIVVTFLFCLGHRQKGEHQLIKRRGGKMIKMKMKMMVMVMFVK